MSIEQIMAAKARADETRLARGRVRKDVAAGRRTVADALSDPCCATARVATVLAWQHRWAEYRAESFLLEHRVCSPFALAGQLTDRQRALIARALRAGHQEAA